MAIISYVALEMCLIVQMVQLCSVGHQVLRTLWPSALNIISDIRMVFSQFSRNPRPKKQPISAIRQTLVSSHSKGNRTPVALMKNSEIDHSHKISLYQTNLRI